jgi:preprotein translocase subunit YajC
MSDEFPNEPEMQSETGGAGFQMDAFIPLVILAISLIVLLGWQVSQTSSQRTMLENALTRGEAAVTQAQQVQGTVSKLAQDLLDAAQTDDTAAQIVKKYNIKQTAPAGDTTGAIPAASASP